MSTWKEQLAALVRTDAPMWRRAFHAGVHHGPEAFVRYSPPLWGMAFGAALPEARASVLQTLRRIHGPRPAVEEMRDVAAVFGCFASSMTDAMLVGSDRGYVANRRPVGDWHFLSRVAAGKGVIVATAQTAGWDIGGGLMVNSLKRDVMVVMQREAQQEAGDLHDATRRKTGVTIVHVGRDPLDSMPLLRQLRRDGGIVALKFDRAVEGMRTRAVRFLGQPWSIPEGPLQLAALSGAPIIPVFTRRLGFLEYQLIVTEPIDVPRRPSEPLLDELAQTLANRLEAFVRAHPTQWFRFRDPP